MRLHQRVPILVSISWLLLAAGAWLLLAPVQLGGRLTYVVVDGNSMEPGFHRGDLLLVRRQAEYRVGDAVTYRNFELGRFVFHRIIATDMDRFILKGDHNTWTDSYHPFETDILGKLWLHIPALGKAIQWIHLPFNMALAASVLGGVLMTSILKTSPPQQTGRKRLTLPANDIYEAGLYVSGILALAFLGMAIFAFTRPSARPAGNISFQQEGFFFYSATGTPGVYDTETVRSGEPVFPKLTCFLNVGFTYNLVGEGLSEVTGTHKLFARVLDERSGWQRTVPLGIQAPFDGSSYFSLSSLDLCYVESLVSLLEQETGLHSPDYTLQIVSEVEMTAHTASGETHDSFSPVLEFKFDRAHFYLANDAEIDAPLQFTKPGLAVDSTLEPNTLQALGLEVSVQKLRGFSLIGLGIFLGAFLLLLWNLLRQAAGDQQIFINFKYGGLLMEVREHRLEPGVAIVDVATIADLARLAERQNTMILHDISGSVHTYLVQCTGSCYRFTLPAVQAMDDPEVFQHSRSAQMGSLRKSRVRRSEISRLGQRTAAAHVPTEAGTRTEVEREVVLRKIKI